MFPYFSGETKFKAALDTAKHISSYFNLETTRVALVTYSDNVNIEFDLDDYLSQGHLSDAFDNVAYVGGSTNTASALDV